MTEEIGAFYALNLDSDSFSGNYNFGQLFVAKYSLVIMYYYTIYDEL